MKLINQYHYQNNDDHQNTFAIGCWCASSTFPSRQLFDTRTRSVLKLEEKNKASNVSIKAFRCSRKNVIAFYPTCPVLTNTSKRYVKFTSNSSFHSSPLVRKIMEINDVASVSLSVNHIKVEKKSHDQSLPWATLKPIILSILLEFFQSDLPVYVESHYNHFYNEQYCTDECRSLKQHHECEAIIEDLINTRIRPFVQEEKGDVVFQKFDWTSGSVYVHFYGTCLLNQKVIQALKEVLFTLLSFYVPRVTSIEQLENINEVCIFEV